MAGKPVSIKGREMNLFFRYLYSVKNIYSGIHTLEAQAENIEHLLKREVKLGGVVPERTIRKEVFTVASILYIHYSKHKISSGRKADHKRRKKE